MKRTRENLDAELQKILGSEYVYFQPPESLKLTYPCIIYSLDAVDNVRADNVAYLYQKRYQLMVVTKDPDSDIWEKLTQRFENCDLDRTAKVDNLNHFYLTLYW